MGLYSNKVIIAINRFPSDTDNEINTLLEDIQKRGFKGVINTAALVGGEGAKELALTVKKYLDQNSSTFTPIYSLTDKTLNIKDKIERICTKIYGANKITYTEKAEEQIKKYTDMGYANLAICMAKTPNSLTDDPKILGAPTNFTITIREVRLSAGVGFIVPLTGAVMTMPGLPKKPLACEMSE
jgi:formate--tetrahydrofolate ligase